MASGGTQSNQTTEAKRMPAESQTEESSQHLILDGKRLALSHGSGQCYSPQGIIIAVQNFLMKTKFTIIVCLPEEMKQDKHLHGHEMPDLRDLQDNPQVKLLYVPSGASEISYMDALSRPLDAQIISQLGLDTWSEPRARILQFTFIKDSFVLFDDPKPNNTKNKIDIAVQALLKKLKNFRKIIEEFKKLDLSFSEEPGKDPTSVFIDGSNVAMSHGQNWVYSCYGIYLTVLHFWNKGYHNITVCIENWRMNSRFSVFGYEYLDDLNKRGILSLVPSNCYTDRLMFEEAKAKNGLIVSNDKFRDFKQEWKDVKNRCISFEFDGNNFKAFLISSESIGQSNVRPLKMEERNTHAQSTGQTYNPDPPRIETTVERDPSLRWLIFDGTKLALRNIYIAVQELLKLKNPIIVCIPENIKENKDIQHHEKQYLTKLQKQLKDLLIYTPPDASFLEALATRLLDALIISQLRPDTWIEPINRILQFAFMKDSFILPDDPWGKKGPSLSTLLSEKTRNDADVLVPDVVKALKEERETYIKILEESRELDLYFSEEPGKDPTPVFIDGSNVAKRLHSCFAIYLIVLHFWNKGYRNITVWFENWRMNSRFSLCGYKYLDELHKRGFLTLTPSYSYTRRLKKGITTAIDTFQDFGQDWKDIKNRLMLMEAKEKKGFIVSNDEFFEGFDSEENVKYRQIPFEFAGNNLIVFHMSSESVGQSSVQPPETGYSSTHLHPDPTKAPE